MTADLTEDQVLEFLRNYAAGAAEALGVDPRQVHVKGGETPKGMTVAMTVSGESATDHQLKVVRQFFEARERLH